MLNICKIRHVDACQKTYVLHDVNICLHDKLHMCDMCRTYVDICPIPIGSQVYPKNYIMGRQPFSTQTHYCTILASTQILNCAISLCVLVRVPLCITQILISVSTVLKHRTKTWLVPTRCIFKRQLWATICHKASSVHTRRLLA